MKRIKKENKEKIIERIRKAGSEEYEVSWDEKGIPKSKKKSKVAKGRLSRAQAARFELKVRKDLKSKGRVVDKWGNNVDLDEGKIVIAKKFNPFLKIVTPSQGFPDFIAIKHIRNGLYSVIGIEVKMNGILSKIEKEKCKWYLQREIFSKILIAKKGKKRGEIEYIDFEKKYGKV